MKTHLLFLSCMVLLISACKQATDVEANRVVTPKPRVVSDTIDAADSSLIIFTSLTRPRTLDFGELILPGASRQLTIGFRNIHPGAYLRITPAILGPDAPVFSIISVQRPHPAFPDFVLAPAGQADSEAFMVVGFTPTDLGVATAVLSFGGSASPLTLLGAADQLHGTLRLVAPSGPGLTAKVGDRLTIPLEFQNESDEPATVNGVQLALLGGLGNGIGYGGAPGMPLILNGKSSMVFRIVLTANAAGTETIRADGLVVPGPHTGVDVNDKRTTVVILP